MVRPILLYGDPILNEVSSEISGQLKSGTYVLIDDMFQTMHKANGVGLSAIQIGVPLKLFIVEAHLKEEDFHMRGVYINPNILREWGELVKHPEGCLSVPGLAGMVERPDNIEMEWYDEKWQKHKEEFSGYAARILQHEYDHLQGIVYTEHLDKLWLKAMQRPLELIETRDMEVPYLWK